MGSSMVSLSQIGAACPVDVKAHPIGLDPFYKVVATEGCLHCLGVFDGLLQVVASLDPSKENGYEVGAVVEVVSVNSRVMASEPW